MSVILALRKGSRNICWTSLVELSEWENGSNRVYSDDFIKLRPSYVALTYWTSLGELLSLTISERSCVKNWVGEPKSMWCHNEAFSTFAADVKLGLHVGFLTTVAGDVSDSAVCHWIPFP